jgi:hypothetical protein
MASGCDSKPTVEDTRPVEHSWAIQQYLDGDEVTPIEREREQESATKPKQKDDW